MKRFFLYIVFGFLLLTLSCGGGGSSSGGGSNVNSTPVISNLSASPGSATLNQGGGAISVTLTFNFYDQGGDLSTGTLFYYDTNGVYHSTTSTIQGVTGQTSGLLALTYIQPTTTRGSTTGGVYVTDSGGRESNHLTGTFTVY